MKKTIESLRYSSREMVRELGFLDYTKHYLCLTPSQVHALIEIDQRGYLTSHELASYLRLDKSSVSRLVKNLLVSNLVSLNENPKDARSKLISCSTEGLNLVRSINEKAAKQVELALSHLSEEEAKMIEKSLHLYSQSLKKSRLLQCYSIREVLPKDNLALNTIIKASLAQFGAARAGFAFEDDSLDNMYEAYKKEGACYYVVEKDGIACGGVGLAELEGGNKKVCELQKLYLSDQLKGLGLGKILTLKVLAKAKEWGYEYCYLETLASMEQANKLYAKLGFEKLESPMGNTGHFGCDSWYLKKL